MLMFFSFFASDSWSDNQRDGASGGFGLTAEPHISVETLTPGTY